MVNSLVLQGCTALLERARKLVSRVEDRYMLFVCEQAKLERMSNDNTAESGMDMVRVQIAGGCSYLEHPASVHHLHRMLHKDFCSCLEKKSAAMHSLQYHALKQLACRCRYLMMSLGGHSRWC